MDINSYYSRPNYQARPQFQTPRATSPISYDERGLGMGGVRQPAMPQAQTNGGMSDNPVESDYRAGFANANDPYLAAMRRTKSDQMATNAPPPGAGEIDPTTNQELSRIYYRHYLNGTYGSPEMMAEVRATVEAYRRREEDRKRLMAPYGAMAFPGQETTAGTFVRPGNFAYPQSPVQGAVRTGTQPPQIGGGFGKPTPPRPTPILGGGLLNRR